MLRASCLSWGGLRGLPLEAQRARVMPFLNRRVPSSMPPPCRKLQERHWEAQGRAKGDSTALMPALIPGRR